MSNQMGFRARLKKAAVQNMIAMLVFTMCLSSMIFTFNTSYTSAATGDYKALVLTASYDAAAVNTYKSRAANRVNGIKGSGTMTDADVDVMTIDAFNCKTFDIQTEYDYILIVANVNISHVGNALVQKIDGYGVDTVSDRAIYNSLTAAQQATYSLRGVESGNDLTQGSQAKLKAYVLAGYPLEFDVPGKPEDCLGNDIVGDPDESTMGHLYSEITGSALLYSTISPSAVVDTAIADVKVNKFTVTMTASPTDYKSGYANSASSTTKTLTYRFTINDDLYSDHTYTTHLYTDDNYDGYFDKATEAMKDMGIVLANNRRVSVEPNQLKAGVEYKMTINASDYVGIFEWQLYVQDNSNARYTHADGTAKLQRSSTQEKEVIRVLQIKDTGVQSNDLPTTYEMQWLDDRPWLTKDTVFAAYNAGCNPPRLGGPATIKLNNENRTKIMYQYYKYLKDPTVSDVFDVRIDRLECWYVDDVVQALYGSSESKYIYDYLNTNFDMLVLGFNDSYGYNNFSDDLLNAVLDFDSVAGKSILMTHDTCHNQTHNDPVREAKIMKIRDLLGSDRFGFAAQRVYTGAELTEAMKNKDYLNTRYEPREALVVASENYFQPQGTILDLGSTALTVPYWDLSAVTGGLVPNASFTSIDAINVKNKPTRNATDFTFNPGVKKSQLNAVQQKLVAQWGGGSDPAVLKIYNINDFKKFYKGTRLPDYGLSEFDLNRYWNACTSLQGTTRVEQVNVGAITTYPYELGEAELGGGINKSGSKISIATSHYQWFELNLNEPDITVWYTLCADHNPNQNYAKNPQDGQNLFYIFSKGNITYSGVGHSGSPEYPSETKLFINTFIAAYRAANKGIGFVCDNWDVDKDSSGNYMLNVDYLKDANDATTNGAIGNDIVVNGSDRYKRVRFTVNDNTVGNNKTMNVEFYKVGMIPGAGTDTEGTPLNYFENSIYEADTGKVVADHNSLTPGKEYYIYVPVDAIGQKLIIQNVITMTYKASGSTVPYVKKYFQYVTLNNQLWFNLG